jgi:hypothetical protein
MDDYGSRQSAPWLAHRSAAELYSVIELISGGDHRQPICSRSITQTPVSIGV